MSNRAPRLAKTSVMGSLPDSQEGRDEGRVTSAAQGRPWWSYIPVVNLVILWAKYGWEGFE